MVSEKQSPQKRALKRLASSAENQFLFLSQLSFPKPQNVK